MRERENGRSVKYRIVSDIPGRIRLKRDLKSGYLPFSVEEACALAEYLSEFTFAEKVFVNYRTGSILVNYKDGFRESVLDTVRGIDLSTLKNAAGTEETGVLDITFRENLYFMVINHFVKKWFIPVPVLNLITVFKGLKFAGRALKSLAKGKIGIEVLDGAAVGTSILQNNYSTAASIMFLLGLSELLEDYTRQRAKHDLSQSLLTTADTVWLERENGESILVPVSKLAVGDKIIVRSGAMIPVDGLVCDGEAGVNQSSMTGEPLAVLKKSGDSVFAGTVLEEGRLLIEARTLSGDSRMARIAELIDRSEMLKAGIQSRSERLADRIVPFSFLLSALVFAFTGNFSKAASVFLVDYSCAIKLSVSISVISAMTQSISNRVLIKGGKFFEEFAQADVIVFDKTGTLTEAAPKVSKVIPFGGYTRDVVLRTAACLEEHFPHSVARAIVRRACEEKLCHEEEHAEVEYIVAHGIATSVGGRRVIIGSRHFVLEDEKVTISDEQHAVIEREAGGDSTVYLAESGANGESTLMGVICINDPPRKEAREVIAQLKNLGIKSVMMLTGDSESTAKAVAEEIGIDRYMSQVLPEKKSAIIEELKAGGLKVIMVGDGINDSPALAAANVSVSMKDASDIARETSDIVLLDSDLYGLVILRNLSGNLLERIRNNFRFIVSVNTGLLLLGLCNVISPATSALIHNFSTMGISASSYFHARVLSPE